jgi:hypothetical protein
MGPLIEDLRFCIGAFFVIVGGLLTVQGLVEPTPVLDINLNLWTGLVFLAFGSAAVTLSLRGASFGAKAKARAAAGAVAGAGASGDSRRRGSRGGRGGKGGGTGGRVAKGPPPGVPAKSPGPPRSFSTTPSAISAAENGTAVEAAKSAPRSTMKSTAKRAGKPSRSKRK